MKAQFESVIATILNAVKQALYAGQVLIIALAIPVLSYMELSHTADKTQALSSKNANNNVVHKTDATAYTITGK